MGKVAATSSVKNDFMMVLCCLETGKNLQTPFAGEVLLPSIYTIKNIFSKHTYTPIALNILTRITTNTNQNA
jgi:hypothetical protein